MHSLIHKSIWLPVWVLKKIKYLPVYIPTLHSSAAPRKECNETPGKDDYSIFNDEDHFNHSTGGTKFYTSPDL